MFTDFLIWISFVLLINISILDCLIISLLYTIIFFYYYIFLFNLSLFYSSFYWIVCNKKGKYFKELKDKYKLKEGDKVEMEANLRPDKRKKRLLYFFINDRLEEVFFSGLPKSVEFGVCL